MPYVHGIFGNQLKVPWQAQAEALGVSLCGIAALIWDQPPSKVRLHLYSPFTYQASVSPSGMGLANILQAWSSAWKSYNLFCAARLETQVGSL